MNELSGVLEVASHIGNEPGPGWLIKDIPVELTNLEGGVRGGGEGVRERRRGGGQGVRGRRRIVGERVGVRERGKRGRRGEVGEQ